MSSQPSFVDRPPSRAGPAREWALVRLISQLLPYISGASSMVFGGEMVLVGGTALQACYLLAYRATRLEPIVVLHRE